MIIDCHTHIDTGHKGKISDKKVDVLIHEMDETGIEQSVVLLTAPKADFSSTKLQNDWIANLCSQNQRIIGFCSIHPDDGEDSLRELERCANTLKLKGIKLHPVVQQFDTAHPFLDKIFKQAAILDLPILIDTFAPLDDSQPGKLLKLVTSNLQTKTILAHAGMTRFQEFTIYPLMKKRNQKLFENIFFDLSAICVTFYKSPYQEQVRWVCEQMGTENLLFGSDFPLYSPRETLAAIRNFGFPQEALGSILGGNLRNLLIPSTENHNPRSAIGA